MDSVSHLCSITPYPTSTPGPLSRLPYHPPSSVAYSARSRPHLVVTTLLPIAVYRRRAILWSKVVGTTVILYAEWSYLKMTTEERSQVLGFAGLFERLSDLHYHQGDKRSAVGNTRLGSTRGNSKNSIELKAWNLDHYRRTPRATVRRNLGKKLESCPGPGFVAALQEDPEPVNPSVLATEGTWWRGRIDTGEFLGQRAHGKRQEKTFNKNRG